jgi:hypothetical protein
MRTGLIASFLIATAFDSAVTALPCAEPAASTPTGADAALVVGSKAEADAHAQVDPQAQHDPKAADDPNAPRNPMARAPALDADAARTALQRGVAWLVTNQRENGAWGTPTCDVFLTMEFSNETHYAFQIGSSALAVRALLEVDETPERRAALEKGARWLCTTDMPKRGNEWDIDCSWSALCGFDACVRLALDKRFQTPEWKALVEKRGKEWYELLEKNQDPLGGWGYYEGPVVSRRPTWSTSFSTALVVPALVLSQTMGWGVDPKLVQRAENYVAQCALPNGAYEYDLNPIPRITGGEMINDVKGSLGRIQVCNLARRKAGDPRVTDEKIRAGLAQFFEYHAFLDVARLKPIPHEAYYQNAAYFYLFGHCFAALCINELPAAEREALHAKLRPHLVKIQSKDGSSFDFLGSSFMTTAGTSFAVMALQAGLPR